MSKFEVSKKVNLDMLGEHWKDCYITVTPLAVNEFEDIINLQPKDDNAKENIKAMKQMIKVVETHFVDGKGWDGQGVIPIEVDDIQQLPIEILSVAIKALSGKTDPKS